MLDRYLPYVIIAVVAVVLIAATVVAARVAWRRQVGRYLLALTRHKEAVAAALRSTESVLGALASAEPPELLRFVHEDSDERAALAEIGERMRIEADELAGLALPKRLWPIADVLGEAASALATQASTLATARGEPALDALSAVDLALVADTLDQAERHIEEAAEAYAATDAVYGGGLYI